MLIFTRKIGETAVVNDDVYITILGVQGNQVRIGFDAPKKVIIHRKEVHDKIKAEEVVLLNTELRNLRAIKKRNVHH